MHLLMHLAEPGGFGSASVQVALIGGAFGTLGILASVLTERGRRRPSTAPAEDDHELRELEVRAYREALIRLGHDPDAIWDAARPRPRPRRGHAT